MFYLWNRDAFQRLPISFDANRLQFDRFNQALFCLIKKSKNNNLWPQSFCLAVAGLLLNRSGSCLLRSSTSNNTHWNLHTKTPEHTHIDTGTQPTQHESQTHTQTTSAIKQPTSLWITYRTAWRLLMLMTASRYYPTSHTSETASYGVDFQISPHDNLLTLAQLGLLVQRR